MEIAYDHVQEAVIEAGDTTPKAGEAGASSSGAGGSGGAVSLNAEFEQAYKAISASPWGMRFGAFVGTVKKQVKSNTHTFSLCSLNGVARGEEWGRLC